MSYATTDDMIALFESNDLIELTNLRNSGATQINLDRLEVVCNGATGIVNGWLLRKYSVPLVGAPRAIAETLRIHAANLAYNLLDGSTEEVRKKADDAIAWLKLFTDASTPRFSDPIVPTLTSRVSSIRFESTPSVWNAASVRDLF